MKIIKRNVPGHFLMPEKIGFFMHTDVMKGDEKDAYNKASFCVSLIGEYMDGRRNLNALGKTYELMVFDKESEDPWTEIEVFYSDDKGEAILEFQKLVKKYSNLKAANDKG